MNDVDILARTLYGEAEPGDEADAIAIAWVVKNRMALRNWPDTAAKVCLQPKQFSCWNPEPVGFPARLMKMKVDDTKAGQWFAFCVETAEKVLAGEIPDPTKRATHYYATWLRKPPAWARGKSPTYSTPAGRFTHLFFNDIDTPAP
jgi:N-acetylmuramoyl-L-alanine amidase